MGNFHAIPKSLQVEGAAKCSISRHYRTFIQKPANSGVQCVLACESVTAAYLNTNQDRRTKILPTQIRPKAFRARRLQRIVPMANARKILIVEDDTDLRDTLVEQLSLHDEFEASAVDTGAKGASAAKANAPDLVLMDVGLPDTDGREVVRSLRKGGFKAPIIMLTGHDTDSDTILGLESGRSCASMKPAKTRCFPSAPIVSGRAPRCSPAPTPGKCG